MKKNYFLLFLLFYVAFSQAQISITAINTAHSENFDGMTATGTTLPSNWVAIKQDGTTIAPVVYTTTSNSGAVYNAGTAAATDRCLGSLASASTIPTFGTRFVNNTGATITQISISGIAEQWRSGSDATANESLVFTYSTDATAINSTSAWTPVTGLNINEINTMILVFVLLFTRFKSSIFHKYCQPYLAKWHNIMDKMDRFKWWW